jgi:hypothetical protein
MKFRALLVAILCFFAVNSKVAQAQTNDDTHLFQTFLEDASINRNAYVQPYFAYADFNYASTIQLGAHLMFPIGGRFQLGGDLSFINASYSARYYYRGGYYYYDSQSGISDLKIVGRYNLDISGPTKVALGAYVTLPTGKPELGQDNVDFGFFASVRHPLSNRLVLTGTGMLQSLDNGPGHDLGLLLAGGLIYQASSTVNLIGELDIRTKRNNSMLTAGIDYNTGGGRLRGSIGLGLDSGAPDVMLFAGYLIPFN